MSDRLIDVMADKATAESHKREREVARVAKMAAGCEAALLDSLAEVERLSGELVALDGRTCTGREYWRDKDIAGKEAKLYVNHSIDQVCPLHGTPEPGKRIRQYVGTDLSAIREAKEAIEREGTRRRLESELAKITRGLRRCEYQLQEFYGLLGFEVQEDGTAVRRGGGRW